MTAQRIVTLQQPSNISSPLPSDIEAEMALLGSILISGSYSYELVDEIGDRLKPQYFYDTKHQLVFQAILALWANQQPIDTIHVLDQMRKFEAKFSLAKEIDQDYLLSLVAKSTLLSDPVKTVKLLKDKYILRSIIGLGEDMRRMGFEQGTEANEILDKAQKKLYEVSLGNVEKNFVSISDIVRQAWDNVAMLAENTNAYRGVPTGFTDLDDKLGGLQKSDMIILACRPSMGKTAMSLEIARRVAQSGVGVAYFSLEMSADQLAERLISATAKVDLHKIRSGNLTGDHNQEMSRIATAIGILADLPLWIDDTGGASILEIRSKARRLKAKHNIGLIVIDYLQLMTGGNDKLYSGNRVQEVSDISRNLKILAKDLDVPIISLSQLSRRVEGRDDKSPVLSDLRESGSIEQDADIVMFIHRDDYYNKESENKGKAKIIIAKNRNGETGFIELAWRSEYVSFDNLYEGRQGIRIEK